MGGGVEEQLRRSLQQLCQHYPKPPGVHFSYGTAGFRLKASLLDSTCARAGVLAALRCLWHTQHTHKSHHHQQQQQQQQQQQGGAAAVAESEAVTGLMVTASHNPACDNGVKIADAPTGGMLAVSWEAHAERLANAADAEQLLQAVLAVAEAEGITIGHAQGQEQVRAAGVGGEGRRAVAGGGGDDGQSTAAAVAATVLLARDTRASGQRLLEAAIEGVGCVPGVVPVSYGVLTTPQLHWLVREANSRLTDQRLASNLTSASSSSSSESSRSGTGAGSRGLPTEADYFANLASSFSLLVSSQRGPGTAADVAAASASADKNAPAVAERVVVDGANGVGAVKLERLLSQLQSREPAEKQAEKVGKETPMPLLPLASGRAATAAAAAAGVAGTGTVGAGVDVEVRNRGGAGDGELNSGVGADFVQKEQRGPHGFDPVHDAGCRCVSLDGDADRLVYFYWDSCPPPVPLVATQPSQTQGDSSSSTTTSSTSTSTSTSAHASSVFRLLDGDKIASLFAMFLARELSQLATSSSSHGKGSSSSSSSSSSSNSTGDVDGGVFELAGYGPVRLGVVQTAYANGASTRFLQQRLRVGVECTATGVKHLHARAEEAFDVAVYFEANGHGTVLVRECLAQWLEQQWVQEEERQQQQQQQAVGSECVENGVHSAGGDGGQPEGAAPAEGTSAEEGKSAEGANRGGGWRGALQRLVAVSRLQNQAVGDALSNLLLAEAILWGGVDGDGLTGVGQRQAEGQQQEGEEQQQDGRGYGPLPGHVAWQGLYQDLPCRQLKVRVKDRSVITTADAERRVVTPEPLQPAIDAAVGKVRGGRSFVRPSGTEDVVRVYAEADTREGTAELSAAVALLVHELAGGVGPPPPTASQLLLQ